MMDLWNYLKKVKKPIFLYGTGNGADKILDRLIEKGIKVTGVYASDGFVRNRTFRGYKVLSASGAISRHGEIITLVSFGSQLPGVIDNIKRISKLGETYAPDVPVIDDGTLFDLEYAKKYKSQLLEAYNLLADDLSKKVFEKIIMYKITGKIDYLFEAETPVDEVFEILKLTDNEVYLDLGAYNGDTVLKFLEKVSGYNKIIAVEPDSKNYKKLIQNTQNIEKIKLINAAVSDTVGKDKFSMLGGRNSTLGNEGVLIDKITIDSITSLSPTYIKFDIEGQEIKALEGGIQTIKLCKPKMNIAAYHKNEDIFAIPILVHSINPQYKIYLRHHPYIPAWDTNYYIV